MTIRSQQAALRLFAIAGVVAAVLMMSFFDTVPNASEMAAQRGWFAVIGNFVSTTNPIYSLSGQFHKSLEIPIPQTLGGDFVPLANVATFVQRRGIDVIRHDQMQMAVTVSADVNPDEGNAIAIVNQIEDDVLPDILGRLDLSFGLGGSSGPDP